MALMVNLIRRQQLQRLQPQQTDITTIARMMLRRRIRNNEMKRAIGLNIVSPLQRHKRITVPMLARKMHKIN